MALLRLLVEHAGSVLGRDTIMASVWPDAVVSDRALARCVRELRKALGKEGKRLLRTAPGRGYVLAAEAAPAESSWPRTRAARRLAAIAVADVVGYARLMGQDEQGTIERLKKCREELVRPLIAEHRGRIVNLVGDSALCEFPSVVDAVAWAVAIQEGMARREQDRPAADRLCLRIGINVGDVIAEDNDIYGDEVNVAARLEGLAEPGSVCISGKVHDEVRDKLDLSFEDLGERALKNIARPVRAWRVVGGAAVRTSRSAIDPLSVAEHNLPQPNPTFVGRAMELEALRRALAGTGRGAITQPRQAISGLGGIGKTQLALAYAYAHLGDYDLIRWLRAEEPATLAADYTGMAPVLGLDLAAPNQAALIAAVRAKLEGGGRWLLVFDNAAEPGSLETYLPRNGSGHVLITSRWREWEGTALALELEELPEPEAIALLLGRDAPDAAQRPAAAGLAQDLGRLPLALAQARAFMRARKVSTDGYRQQLAAARSKVLTWRPPNAGYPLAVAQAWQASLDQAARDCPAAAELMRLLAFLAPDAVPRDLLGAAVEALPEGLRDPFDRDTAIEALGRFSLVRVEPGSLAVHRLVQAVTRDGLDEATARSCAELAVRLVDAALPRPLLEHAHRPAVARLLPHALAAAEASERFGVGLAAAGTILSDVGTYLREGAAYSEAEPLLRRAVALREQVLGPDHPDLATSVDSLAQLYHATERPADAEPLYRRALAVRERVLGPEHPAFAESLGRLGLFYLSGGRRAEAEPLLQRAIATYERTIDSGHADLAGALEHWAWLHHKSGRPAEAEPLLQRAIAVAERTLGPEHPRIATFLINLAGLYQDTGRRAEAEPLYRRALAIRERALGPEHPELAIALNRLAWLCHATGRPGDAEPLFQRALAIRERAFGPDHPSVIKSLSHLGRLYHDNGRYAEAEPLCERALAICERAFGREHQDLVRPLRQLANVFINTGRFAEAEPLLVRALAIQERVLGPEHPHVAGPLYQLAVVHLATGRPTSAEPLLLRALPIQERALGPEHAHVGNSLFRLAQAYLDTGRPAAAEPLLRRALALRELALGPEHPKLASPLELLATVYRDTARLAEAEPLFRRCCEILGKTLRPDHPNLVSALGNHAALLDRLGRGREADGRVPDADRRKSLPSSFLLERAS